MTKTVIEMVREAGASPLMRLAGEYVDHYQLTGNDALERFAALVREDEREKQQEPVAWVKAKELAIAKSLSDDGYAKQWSTTLGFKKEDGDIPLYTTPPTAAIVARQMRDACASILNNLDIEPEYQLNLWQRMRLREAITALPIPEVKWRV